VKKNQLARQEAAAERQALRDARGPLQQLHTLIQRGHGHCKEADKMSKQARDRELAKRVERMKRSELKP